MKQRLHGNKTILSSLAHKFSTYTTSKKITGLHDTEREKCQKKGFQRCDEPSEYSSKK